MSKFINPFSDYGFKLIFGSEVSKDLIISFLNGVLHDEVIINITFRNVEMLGMKQDQRRAVFDIFCENEKGEFFIVEMQKTRQKYFSDRILYYASFAIQQQSVVTREKLAHLSEEERKQHWDYNINKVYIVCILNYVMAPGYPDKYRWDVVRMDRELKIPFLHDLLHDLFLYLSFRHLQNWHQWQKANHVRQPDSVRTPNVHWPTYVLSPQCFSASGIVGC